VVIRTPTRSSQKLRFDYQRKQERRLELTSKNITISTGAAHSLTSTRVRPCASLINDEILIILISIWSTNKQLASTNNLSRTLVIKFD
jgi:hypothetical protein